MNSQIILDKFEMLFWNTVEERNSLKTKSSIKFRYLTLGKWEKKILGKRELQQFCIALSYFNFLLVRNKGRRETKGNF